MDSTEQDGYGVLQYVLDRANIYDTITRMAGYTDCREFDRLAMEVFAPEVTVDLALLSGEEPRLSSAREEAQTWKAFSDRFTATQHIMTCILVNLPQPPVTANWIIPMPVKATASANALVTLRRDRARGDPMLLYGAYYTFELARYMSGSGMNVQLNPWRITHVKIHPFWFKGNMDVMA